MEQRYRRLPALLVLIVATAIGALYVRSWARHGNIDPASLTALENRIADGQADAQTWLAYGDHQAAAGKHAEAAIAYRKALELAPLDRNARIGCAMALAQSGQSDALYEFLSEMAVGDAKLAMDILDGAVVKGFRSEPRFAALYQDARAQAMD